MLNQRKGTKRTFTLKRLGKTIRKLFFLKKKNSSKKKIRTRQRTNYLAVMLAWIFKRQKAILSVTAILLVIITSIFIISRTVFGPRYSLATILVDPASQVIYNNPLLFAAVQESFVGKNYFLMRRGGDNSIIESLKTSFPHIQDISLTLIEDQVAQVSISYNDPTLIFLLPGQRRFASYNQTLFLLGENDFINSNAPVIELPRYTESLPNIDGIFFQISERRLLDTYTIIHSTLGDDNIFEYIYLPGGEKIFVTYKSKRLFFHLNKDINNQLAKLIDVENFYESFDQIVELDLGSLDDVIVR